MRGTIIRASIWATMMVGLLTAPAMAATNEVTVIRGTGSNHISKQPAAGVPTVLRGWGRGTPRRQPKPEPKLNAAQWVTIGGDTLWFVERNGRRMIGCWLQNGTQVGSLHIQCGQTPRR